MAQYVNRNAFCDNCKNNGGKKDPKSCRKCSRMDGRPGWEPAPGVQVRLSRDMISGKLFREVI